MSLNYPTFLIVVFVDDISLKLHRYSPLHKDESVLVIALWGLNPAAYSVIREFQSLVNVFVMIPGNQRNHF